MTLKLFSSVIFRNMWQNLVCHHRIIPMGVMPIIFIGTNLGNINYEIDFL
jgi:hypothetical protein